MASGYSATTSFTSAGLMFFVTAADAGWYHEPLTQDPVFMGRNVIRTNYGGW